jgi:hypothetical protein
MLKSSLGYEYCIGSFTTPCQPLTLLKLSSPNIILNNIGLVRPRGFNGTSKIGSGPPTEKNEMSAKAISNYHRLSEAQIERGGMQSI